MMKYKPMLAYPVSSKPIDYSKPVFIQPKLDGVRCLIQYDKTNGVKAYSRTGKEWKNIEHILENLMPFFCKRDFANANVILDGELYNHDFRDDFESIISMVRKTKPTDEDRLKSAENVQFHCYDIIHPDKSLFADRISFINHCLHETDYVKVVPTTRVYKHEEALNMHNDAFLANGYEGSILRTNDEYQCKRTHSLRKFKDFHDTEATITGWVDGKGKRVGTIGKFLAVDADGIKFGMPVMDNFKYLQDNFKLMQGYVGKTATFTYFERTKANSYRHPLFKCIRNYE